MIRLNLGCGHKRFHRKGWVNVDNNPECEPDVLLDVGDTALICPVGEEGWLWVDDSIDRARADNLLEHLDNEGFKVCMNEAHRVLKPGGVFWIKVPDALNWPEGQMADPTHKRSFCWPRSFYYLREDRPQWQNYGKFYGFTPWKLLSGGTDGRFITVELTPCK